MTLISSLNGSHLRTYETIFQHPLSHNLNWREVRALLQHLGQITEEPNGHVKATRNGHTLLLHRPHTKDVADAHEVIALRHFLHDSEQALPGKDENEDHWLLVIDHHSARLFRSEIPGAAPQRIVPREPEGFMHTTHDSAEVSRGKEIPNPHSFFEPIAQALQKARQIIVFGAGTGTSSEMVQFIAWLKIHHFELSQRIVGSLAVDGHHLTNDQLIAKAGEFYAGVLAEEADDAEKQDESWKKLI